MIDGKVEADDAGVGNEAVAGFKADDTGPGGGNADRAALVATKREIDHILRNGDRRAA